VITKYIYHVEAKYEDYDPTKDKAISSMAKKAGGKVEGSGTDLRTGLRDLGFLFKSRTEANKFISILKANKIRHSGISNWSRYLSNSPVKKRKTTTTKKENPWNFWD